MQTINYWLYKDSELQAMLEELNIELPDGEYNRKKAIDAIKLKDVEAEVKKTKTYIEQIKEEKPTLKLVKVIFHSTGEQDLPYVFVGHNGRGFYIPKEIEVDVPKYILDSCIKDAVEDRMMPRTRVDGSIEWVIRKVQRFPYSVVDL